VHPVLPYVLTSSDDMLIKLWDWDKGWACVQVFEGHNHYVRQVCGLRRRTWGAGEGIWGARSCVGSFGAQGLGQGLGLCAGL
jgi:WD40 repeat protein